jgi:hypothetical protein
MNFQALRDQWALKAPFPSKDRIETQMQMDRNANPHNEPYHNKKPRRSEAEIVSDLSYSFADAVLTKQYGDMYKGWLNATGYTEVWGVVTGGQLSIREDKFVWMKNPTEEPT